jgi:hypothetical protein
MPNNIKPGYIEHFSSTCHKYVDRARELLYDAEFEAVKKELIELSKFIRETIKDCNDEME